MLAGKEISRKEEVHAFEYNIGTTFPLRCFEKVLSFPSDGKELETPTPKERN